jgi:hypothetical protein
MATPRSRSTYGKWTVVLLCLALGGTAVVVAFWTNQTSLVSPIHADSSDLESQLRLGHEKQLNRDWGAARAIFQDLQRKLDADSRLAPAIREEVARNLRLLDVLVSESTPENVSAPVPPKKTLPPKLSEAMLLERYPVGKTVSSHGHFRIEGKGHNTAWGTKAAAAFSYSSELPVETRVIESDPAKGRLVFEQTFGDVLQMCAVSDRTLELVSPDSSALVWVSTADHTLSRLSAGYRQFRDVAEAINAADPGLKSVLTALSGSLLRAGIPLQPSDQVSFAVQIEKLTGTKLKIVYVSGLGVTHIAQLEGDHKFEPQELIRLAHASTVMVDHFVIPASKTAEGDSWEVKAEEVGSLIALYDPSIELGGSLQFHRATDIEPGKMAQLEVIGGSVTAQSESDQRSREGRLSIRHGSVQFDLTGHFVDRAVINFSAQSLMQSRGHLLFGTEQLRDLKIESRYQARLPHSEQTSSTHN